MSVLKEEVTLLDTSCRWGIRMKEPPIAKRKICLKKPLSVNKLNYRANIDMNLTKTTQLYFGVDGYVNSYVSPGGGNTDLVWSAVQQLTPFCFRSLTLTARCPYMADHVNWLLHMLCAE